ncbi:MAG: SDR family NAD(P)-dependent oxidoreductase, partial [Dongiales bacterium]
MLKGRCALVTGSSNGLGFAIAEGLARAGCDIMLTGLESAAEKDERCRGLAEAEGVAVAYHPADLATPAGVEQLIAATESRFGGIDILVNNAVVRHFARIDDFPTERWDQALAVNLSAAFHTIRLSLPGMRQRKWGRIINMSSVYGSFAIAERIDYVTTKTALLGLTRVVALETLDDEITCNAVCPGSVLTPYSEQRLQRMMAAEGLTREAAVEKFLADRQPAGRFVASENVAALIVFLCG